MLISMTGFGTGSASDGKRSARIEARAVNHRYLDVVLHLPRHYASCEDKAREVISERISRGRVEIFATVEDFGAKDRTVRLDKTLLTGYVKAVSEAGAVIGRPLALNVESLLALPGLFQVEEVSSDVESAWPVVEQALVAALDNLVVMRQTEGNRLQDDMLGRLTDIENWFSNISNRAPVIVVEYKQRLENRITELLGTVPVPEDRLAAEVALFADRVCITEELVRAASHITHFREACTGGGSVGRKLDFLLQELNREVNTIASKAADGQIAQLVVGIKAELEKVREQVQNIE